MKIDDRVYVHGYVDEIRKDTVIIRNEGGCFGTVKSEIVEAQKAEDIVRVIRCKDCIYARMTINGDSAKYCLAWQDGDALMMDSLYLPADFYCAYAERKEE